MNEKDGKKEGSVDGWMKKNLFFSCFKLFRDVRCGRIHCLSNRADHKLIRGQERTTFWATYDRKTFCM